jgi:uncharacterized protein (TIGR01777 family)
MLRFLRRRFLLRVQLQLRLLQEIVRILLSGASGFIGKPLGESLKREGHALLRLVRFPTAEPDAIAWDPETGVAVKEQFEGFDAVIHLSGEPIFKRWTRRQRQKILFSRTVSTFLLSHILATALRPPKVFATPSAVGYYGNRGEEELTEESEAGRGFLPNVCCEWEKASAAIRQRGARCVQLRFGIVLGSDGGALQKILLPYRLGLGGRLGSGRQWMSWIALEDAIRAVEFALQDERCSGPVNVVSPHPVRQEDFSKRLAALLHRPALLHQPAWMLRLAFGQMADELLLASAKASPQKLLAFGFAYRHPSLDSAFLSALKSSFL